MEKIALTTPYVIDPRSTSTFQIDGLTFSWKDKRIIILLGDSDGVQRQIEYADLPGNPVATNMMLLLNKANLTSNSLHKRVINQLISDGHIAGTISGSPD